jgi:hypothetical protein
MSGHTEPVVTPEVDRFMIACPECGWYGTHTEICSWSFARRGEIWVFFAEKLSLVPSNK